MSTMGERFIFYDFIQPDRRAASKKAMANATHMDEKREHLKACMTNYINYVLENSKAMETEIVIDEETMEDITNIATFATTVRSGISTDFRTGLIDFVPSVEMPTRVTKQLYTLAVGFVAMELACPGIVIPSRVGKIPKYGKELLYKTAFDSIPRTRRDALYPLAKYKGGVTTSALAVEVALPTQSISKYLQQLNALGVCNRIKKGGSGGDLWIMTDEYRELMKRFQGIEAIEGIMESKEREGFIDDYPLSNRDENTEGESVESLDENLL